LVNELEDNDNQLNAQKIDYNETVIGSLSSQKDIDVFKFSVSKAPIKISLEFFEGDPNSEKNWDVVIYSRPQYYDTDIYGAFILNEHDNMYNENKNNEGNGFDFYVEKNGTYYVAIRQNDKATLESSTGSGALSTFEENLNYSDTEYQFTLKASEIDLNYGYEYNDSKRKASQVEVGSFFYGNLHDSKKFPDDDVDFYKFNHRSEDDTIKVSFDDNNSSDSDQDTWDVVLYDKNLNIINNLSFTEEGSFNSKTNLKGTFYLSVSQWDELKQDSGVYRLMIETHDSENINILEESSPSKFSENFNENVTILEPYTSTKNIVGTLNYSSGDDIIIIGGQSKNIRGLSGDDTYFISHLISKEISLQIVDTVGENIIQIPINTFVSESLFTKNAMRITLEGSREITISNADRFSYSLGEDFTNGDTREDLSYQEFALAFGVDDVLSLESSANGTIIDQYII